jgi:cytochrome P450
VATARPVLLGEARSLLDALPNGGAVADFGATVSVPWGRAVTARLMPLDDHTLERAWPHAQVVFEAAAFSPDGEAGEAAKHATAALARSFGTGASPAAVQAFVALSQSLPALVNAAVLALLEQPAQLAWLRSAWRANENRTTLIRAAHELLRFATPTVAVFRRAIAAVQLGSYQVATGDLVVLRLADANRDGAVFSHPDRLDLTRERWDHLSFGAGPHRCAGASVIRLLLEMFLEGLTTSPFELTRATEAPVEMLAGPALRAPRVLPVRVRRL